MYVLHTQIYYLLMHDTVRFKGTTYLLKYVLFLFLFCRVDLQKHAVNMQDICRIYACVRSS